METLKIIMSKTCLLFPQNLTVCGVRQGSTEIIPKVIKKRNMTGDQCDKDGECRHYVSDLRISVIVHADCISFAKERIKIL